MNNEITPLEQFRRDLHVGFAGGVAQFMCQREERGKSGGRKNQPATYLAEMANEYVDAVCALYKPDQLIPRHCSEPLRENVLRRFVDKEGRIVRTVKIPADEFYAYNESDRLDILNDAMVADGHGDLTDIHYRMVGFCDEGKFHFFEVDAFYNPPED